MKSKAVALAAVFAALSLPHALAADWERVIITLTGDRTDVPPPHNLAYFTEAPAERDLDKKFCESCGPKEKAEWDRAIAALRGEIHHVGAVRGFEIFDVFYQSDSERSVAPGDPVWKSVLVKIGPDQYREVYHHQGTEDNYEQDSELVGPVLKTEYSVGAMGMRTDEFFWFDETGSTRVNQAWLESAASNVAPHGDDAFTAYGLYATNATPAVVFHIPTSTPGRVRCGGPGEAEVTVAMVKGHPVVTNARYVSGPK